MERAGRGVVDAVFAQWPDLAVAPGRAVVLCGPGNNGGDGFVVARLLRGKGWAVEVFLYGDPGRLPPDASVNHARWLATGPVAPLDTVPPAGPGPDLWIDALFGIGLRRAVGLPLARLAPRDIGGRVVAIDVPSGLCADSGRRIGVPDGCVTADLTVTFHARKHGHLLADGPAACGRLVVADIGLPPGPAPGADRQRVVETQAPRLPAKSPGAHKYVHGHAVVLTGPAGRTGAARLAARGALRVGAGLVTVGAPPDALPECAAQLTAIMLRETGQGEDLTTMLEDRRIGTLCLGPGLGLDARAEGLVAAALEATAAAACSVVLDADALTILSRRPDLIGALHARCVLTPHEGEFARLFPDMAAQLAAPAFTGPAFSKVDATRDAAARAGCVVLYKGPDTVIADPAGRAAIHPAAYDRAAPWLATAGSGDVLAGFIAGLLARGFSPFDAACAAAWLHVECALEFGPGLIAEDLPEQLPAVFRRLA
jgi:hydroxyethylthiazole kinase-like uncharacterized protein yjeF